MFDNLQISLLDSISTGKKTFSPKKGEEFSVYVCGVTPYAPSHLGHGRSYINFDILIRMLKFLEFEVKYIRNFTDIDDKLLSKAEQELGCKHRYLEIANQFIDDFKTQTQALNCLEPETEPRATETIDEIVELVETLIKKDFAYKSGLDVFFDISKFTSYGKLSKKNIADLVAGARVAQNENKKNPLDFVLWKGNDTEEFWNTSLGWGRPGWHIECSAMIAKNTSSLKIHGGGADLIFPHHENEIAQSEAAFGKSLAQCWLHNGLLNINKEKMSKSGVNSMAMQDFFKNTNPADFRFYVLQHNYRSPIDFSPEMLSDSAKARAKLASLKNIVTTSNFCENISDLEKMAPNLNLEEREILEQIIQALTDDLNTAMTLGLIFKHFDLIKKSETFCNIIVEILEKCLGLVLLPTEEKGSGEAVLTPEILALIEKRNVARTDKNWAVADAIREQLSKMGYKQSDEKKK